MPIGNRILFGRILKYCDETTGTTLDVPSKALADESFLVTNAAAVTDNPFVADPCISAGASYSLLPA